MDIFIVEETKIFEMLKNLDSCIEEVNSVKCGGTNVEDKSLKGLMTGFILDTVMRWFEYEDRRLQSLLEDGRSVDDIVAVDVYRGKVLELFQLMRDVEI